MCIQENQLLKKEKFVEEMPFVVVVIDEMVDLMMVAGKEVESLVQRPSTNGKELGIPNTATQRPKML